jgi:hypothetical protein
MTVYDTQRSQHPDFCGFGFGGDARMCIFVRRSCFDRTNSGEAEWFQPLRDIICDLICDFPQDIRTFSKFLFFVCTNLEEADYRVYLDKVDHALGADECAGLYIGVSAVADSLQDILDSGPETPYAEALAVAGKSAETLLESMIAGTPETAEKDDLQ